MLSLAKFFLKVENTPGHPKVYIGIDPGSTGAIGFICGNLHTVVDIPTLKVKRGKGNKTAFDLMAIVRMFRFTKIIKDSVYVLLEKPPPSMGPAGAGFGGQYAQVRITEAYAIWPLFILQKGFHLEEVAPQVWKKAMGVPGGADKETGRHKAIGMFPRAELSRKKDHGRAEALLIAEFHRRRLEGKL